MADIGRLMERLKKKGMEWMDRSENESKKITIKLSMEEETDQMVDSCILNRDRQKYKTIKDYICAAVCSFAEKEPIQEVVLSEQAEDHLCEKLAGRLAAEGYRYKPERPGL